MGLVKTADVYNEMMGILIQNLRRFRILLLVAVKYFYNYSECNGKFVSLHAMKAYGSSEIKAPLILYLSTRWRLVELKALVVFTLNKQTPVTIKQQSGWRAELYGHILEEEYLIPPRLDCNNSSFFVQPAACSLI